MNKLRILVVDDEPNLSALLCLVLERTQRYEVRVENRPACARTAAREFRPHLVLLDVEMPGKNGGDVEREFKADSLLCGVPVLFLTSLISHEEAGGRETMRGGKRFLAKPVDAKVLVETVDRVVAAEAKAAWAKSRLPAGFTRPTKPGELRTA